MKACNHDHKGLKMGYMQWYTWIENKIKYGAKQRQCPVCKLWFFKSEANDPKFSTWPEAKKPQSADLQDPINNNPASFTGPVD